MKVRGSLRVVTAVVQGQSAKDTWSLETAAPHHADIHEHTLSYMPTLSASGCARDIPASVSWTEGNVFCQFPSQSLQEALSQLPKVQQGCQSPCTLSQEGGPLGRRNESKAVEREVGLMSFPSFGDTQPSCHPVASKKHSSNHLVLSAEVQGTARERKEGRSQHLCHHWGWLTGWALYATVKQQSLPLSPLLL